MYDTCRHAEGGSLQAHLLTFLLSVLPCRPSYGLMLRLASPPLTLLTSTAHQRVRDSLGFRAQYTLSDPQG